MESDDLPWGEIDANGFQIALVGKSLASGRNQRRRRRNVTRTTPDMDVWPLRWRELLSLWVRNADPARWHQWETLLRTAGAARTNDAVSIIGQLTSHGQVEIEQRRERTDWQISKLRWTNPSELRKVLGLREPDADQHEWHTLRSTLEGLEPTLQPAVLELDACPPKTAIARAELLTALSRWKREGRAAGTRRDFALFARGNTKAVSDSDWQWLEGRIELGLYGISGHAPLMFFRLLARATTDAGSLDLDTLASFVALPPASVLGLRSVSPAPVHWRVVENRTVFDRLSSRSAEDEFLVWVPGYPPSWWLEGMRHLLTLAPAPALISCDPDPDGIAIALATGAVWESIGLGWSADRMSPDDLEKLPAHRDVSERDLALLDRLEAKPLPMQLQVLATRIRACGKKGEQEGLF